MIDPASCLSTEVGPLGPRVEDLVREYREIWMSVPSDPFPLGKRIGRRAKKSVERELTSLVDRISEDGRNGLGQDPDRLEDLAAILRPFLKRVLGLTQLPLESVYDKRFVESTRLFLEAARDFDPGLGVDAVYQALRNVWIMNTLQFEMGLDVRYTKAVFGYSMVYPYLDNFLDDDAVSTGDKLATLVKLKAWLEGRPGPAEGPREEKLRALIGLIEGRFSRLEHPGVFRSMLAIYNAQIKSLLQQKRTGPASARDILGISLEKGGTSVLADGYLVAGDLHPGQEDFCFGFGAFLQMADDLQDLEDDAGRGHLTLFSPAAGPDGLDDRLFKFQRFIAAVLDKTANRSNPETSPLREIIRRACSLMAMESVGNHRRHFSRKCVRLCRASFPVHFSHLRKLRRKLGDRFFKEQPKISDIDPVLAAFLAVSSRALALD